MLVVSLTQNDELLCFSCLKVNVLNQVILVLKVWSTGNHNQCTVWQSKEATSGHMPLLYTYPSFPAYHISESYIAGNLLGLWEHIDRYVNIQPNSVLSK